MKELSYNQLSDLTGFTYRTVKKRLENAGIKPVRKDGNAHLFNSVDALQVLFVQQVPDENEEDITDYTILLEKEKHREKKRQNDLEEKLIAPVGLMIEALEKSGNIIIAELESLPLMLKRAWPEITGDQIQLVKKTIAECRNAIADSKLEI